MLIVARHLAMLLPSSADRAFTIGTRGYERTESSARTRWEKACRQRWRSLALVVKAKLEAIESGITTFEREFLGDIVLSDDSRVGERIIPMLNEIAGTGKLPSLPSAPSQDKGKVVAIPDRTG
jgi:hypothetical protein